MPYDDLYTFLCGNPDGMPIGIAQVMKGSGRGLERLGRWLSARLQAGRAGQEPAPTISLIAGQAARTGRAPMGGAQRRRAAGAAGGRRRCAAGAAGATCSERGAVPAHARRLGDWQEPAPATGSTVAGQDACMEPVPMGGALRRRAAGAAGARIRGVWPRMCQHPRRLGACGGRSCH